MQDRVLLVDDDASLLKLLAIRLEAEGFSVFTAPSAEEAMQLLRNQSVEVVVTDLRMEGASGLDLQLDGHSSNPEVFSNASGIFLERG